MPLDQMIDYLPETALDNLAVYAANGLTSSMLDPLRMYLNAWNYALRIMVVPGSINAVIAPSQSFEDQVSIVPGSYLTMITGAALNASNLAALTLGFRLQIYDQGAGRALYSTDVSGQSLSGGTFQTSAVGSEFDYLGTGQPLGPFILPSPLVVLKPGQLNVKVVNLDPVNAADIQVALFFAVPRDAQPDQADQVLGNRSALVGKTKINSHERKC